MSIAINQYNAPGLVIFNAYISLVVCKGDVRIKLPPCVYNMFNHSIRHVTLNKKGGENPMLFAPKEKAQGLVEYALILVLVAVVVIVILALLGPAIGKIFSNVVTAI